LLYNVLKVIARLAIRIFCRKIVINKPDLLTIKGPVLLACNHPNSFLDSILLDTLFHQPVWSLARGDAFKNKTIRRILTALKILPVYRTSEGVENLSENYKTFEACIALFRQKGIVTIFSEGKCINEWHLRPLKKGTARLAVKAWEEGIPLTVLPVGINYSSFTRFGKNVFINFGEIITSHDINSTAADGLKHQTFNAKLNQQLAKLVIEIPKNDRRALSAAFIIKIGLYKKMLLIVPAVIGWLLHFPLYIAVKKIVWKKTHDNDHFDSVMFGVLFFTYPLYVIGVSFLAVAIIESWWPLLLFVLMPCTAWCLTQVKPQTASY
jgi:1-acyl-sn-glycerol-3-phosphate acyltransferase